MAIIAGIIGKHCQNLNQQAHEKRVNEHIVVHPFVFPSETGKRDIAFS